MKINKRQSQKRLQSTRFAATPGPVEILLERENKITEKLICSEWITDKPYRTDRQTYSFSYQLESSFKEIFRHKPLLYSQEYNADVSGNNFHFYKKQ